MFCFVQQRSLMTLFSCFKETLTGIRPTFILSDKRITVFIQELLKETRQEWANRVVELLYSIFCLDTQQITLTLLGTILPNLLTDSAHWHSLADPPGKALAK